MTKSERKEKEKEMRRNDIIDAAEKVFFAQGYDSSTMDDVAKEAEFSKRTVYVYFNSKEQLYFEIMLRGFRLFNEMCADVIKQAETDSALETVTKLGETLLAFNVTHPDYAKAIMEYETTNLNISSGLPETVKEECYAEGEKILNFLKKTINTGIQEGVIRADIDVTSTTLILWASIVGVFQMTRKKEKYLNLFHHRTADNLVQEAFSFFTRSIERQGGEKNV